MPAVMWFRRDLHLSDDPALLDAAARDGDVLPLFDPDGAYIRTWVPELRDAHEPVDPIVDHAEERREALDR